MLLSIPKSIETINEINVYGIIHLNTDILLIVLWFVSCLLKTKEKLTRDVKTHIAEDILKVPKMISRRKTYQNLP